MSEHPGSVLVICGTDRANGRTAQVAAFYERMLKDRGVVCDRLNLDQLPRSLDAIGLYQEELTPEMRALVERYVIPHRRMVFVVPEYNSSFPGILKVFIDAVRPHFFAHKVAALVGISDGHTGNLRGLDQLQQILNYLRMEVLALKPKLSTVGALFNTQDELVDERAVRQLHEQMERLLVTPPLAGS